MFLERLNNLILGKGITRNKLLLDLGINHSAFDSWKNRDTIPSGKILLKIADYFGVSVDYLLGKESNNADLPEQDKKVLDMLHNLDKTGKEKAEQYLELLSLQYGKTTIEDEIDELISALPDKKDNTVTMRIAAFGGGVREVKVSKDDLRDVVNMLEEEEEN